jgi:voltage-gated potassium channel
VGRWREASARWRAGRKAVDTALRERWSFTAWYPQAPIAVLMAPLGLLLIALAVEAALGVELMRAEFSHFEESMSLVGHRPTVELALGVSLTAISVGVALGSRLAWLWAVGVTSISLALRLPPLVVDLPYLLYLALVLTLLVYHRRSFVGSSVLTSTVFSLIVLATFLTWATLGALRLGDQFQPPIEDVETALYFSVVTASSVGFGDIAAKGSEARLFVLAVIALGLFVGATAIGTVLLPLIGNRLHEALGGKAKVDRSNHYVIVGKSPLARNAAVELEMRGQAVTLVLAGTTEEDFYSKRDVVVGDPTAGAEKAKGVLALSEDDSTNGFVVLGVNELNTTVPAVAALNDSANRFRIERTQPSLLLSLQSLGGELLAMALTGEHVGTEMLNRVLQVQGGQTDTQS